MERIKEGQCAARVFTAIAFVVCEAVRAGLLRFPYALSAIHKAIIRLRSPRSLKLLSSTSGIGCSGNA
jgi:hypothetical protein